MFSLTECYIALTISDDLMTLTGAIRSGKEFRDMDKMPVQVYVPQNTTVPQNTSLIYFLYKI
jgi:hypothetical protein